MKATTVDPAAAKTKLEAVLAAAKAMQQMAADLNGMAYRVRRDAQAALDALTEFPDAPEEGGRP